MRKILIILTISFLCLFSYIPILAQEEIDLGEIVVTATKTEKSIKEVPQTVSIITKEDIGKLDNKNLGDVLREVPGVNIISYGSLGSLNVLTLRGLSERRVSFLLDGVPLYQLQNGDLDLSSINLSNVDKIEVLKGSASSLYGANALAGVVNIITKKAGKTSEFKISSGKYDTRKYFGNYGGGFGNLKYLISAERQTSSGIRKWNNDYEGDSLNIKLDYKNNYILSYTKYKSERGVPGPLTPPIWGPPDQLPYWPSKLSRQWDDNDYLNFMFKRRFSNNQELTLKLYRQETYLKYFSEFNDVDWVNSVWLSKTSIHENTTDGLELQDNIRLNGKNLIVGGYELQNFKNNSTDTGKHKTRNSACYLQWENKNFRNTIINLGIRQDDHHLYGKNNSGRLSLVYNYDENILYRIVYGKAFVSPTFNDLYWPADAWAEGNPNLVPEKGENFEISTEYQDNRILCKFSIFRNDIKDLIQWAPYPDFKWRPKNIGKAEITGSEVEIDKQIAKNVFANFNFTFLDAFDKTEKKKIIYRPDLRANFSLSYKKEALRVAFIGRYTDRRVYEYDWTGAPKYLPSNMIYDTKVSRDFDRLNLSISVKNIFDKKYQEEYDYPALGRVWNFEIGYRL